VVIGGEGFVGVSMEWELCISAVVLELLNGGLVYEGLILLQGDRSSEQ